MTLFRREFRNPFELVVARRPDPVQSQPVEPGRPSIRIGKTNYELHEDPRVRVPELPLAPDPALGAHFWARSTASRSTAPDRPEVVLREAVRLCLEKEVSTDRIAEIIKLELVDFVMES
ncbi:hypothetical protein LCGC14_2381060 [marine sediment metagenome]|uniref:Uncharacterized protein n=1 Tax=marine sediment metagenome TaxID=412755 RepID=A0A0F9EDC9_9ZZZZ